MKPVGQDGVTGSEIGSTVGTVLGSIIPGIGTVIGSAIGDFIGDVIGTLIGNALQPNASAEVYVGYSGGKVVDFGGTDQSPDNWLQIWGGMVNAVTGGVNDIVGMTGGQIQGATSNYSIAYYTKTDRSPGNTAYDVFYNGAEQVFAVHYAGSSDYSAVTTGLQNVADTSILDLLHNGNITGADPIMLTALGAALSQDANAAGVQTDMQVAQDYEKYLSNTDMYNALIAANADNSYGAGWLLTLKRAEELGLGDVVTGTGYTAKLTGNDEEILNASGVVSEEIFFNADGSQTAYNYAQMGVEPVDNTTYNVAAGSTQTVIGHSDTINAGSGATLTLTGTNLTINGSSLAATLTDAASATIVGSDDAVTLGSHDNVSLSDGYSGSGSGSTIDVTGIDNQVTVADAAITLEAAAAATIFGSGNSINALAGAALILGTSTTGTTVSASGGTLTLDDSASATATGSNEAVTMGNATTLTVTGTGGHYRCDRYRQCAQCVECDHHRGEWFDGDDQRHRQYRQCQNDGQGNRFEQFPIWLRCRERRGRRGGFRECRRHHRLLPVEPGWRQSGR